MKTNPAPAICVRVDPSNPGQFFACCGLLELADRLWNGAEGWFEKEKFCLRSCSAEHVNLRLLLQEIGKRSVEQIDSNDDRASPMKLPRPFALRIDWWKDDDTGGDQLKVWAGSMCGVRIARAMQAILGSDCKLHNEDMLDYGRVVCDPQEPAKKVEPFYFDARRGANARALDIGFMPDSLSMTTVAYPAVEFLCLVGLQRFRPKPTDRRRGFFEYFTWSVPLTTQEASLAVTGLLPFVGSQGYRFQIAFRTDQKKHKAFTPAIPLERSEV